VQTDGPVSHHALTEHVRGLLPAYLVPSRYVDVASMPRTASGKVDPRALARIDLPAPEPSPGATSLAGVITDIWTRVLGHDEFDGSDDFFDVGGDSLLATWVAAELGQALGRPVELSVFLEHSTVEGLTGALGSAAPGPERRPRSRIVTLRPGPSARSVYLIHPLGGELLGYRELARASRAPARLLGIGWAGDPPADGCSLAEIARTHIAQLRRVEPDGPYRLAGWSFGGVLAFEMAQQLTAAGGVVEFLGLLDANPVLDPITGRPIAETPFLRMLDVVAARLDDPAVTAAELAELTSTETWIHLMGAPIAAGASTGYLRTALDTARACMSAAMRYRPRPYPGPVDLFQASGSGRAHQAELAAALRGVCSGRCTVSSIPGDHWGFIRGEHVTAAASELDAALERAGAAGSATHGS
jgi:thioesterase domain-containing protein